ncbi:Bug family tripartite tricarboxylate transporter substrate binding protein [Pararhodobacter marinus]|uniref:Bug family tripartite tricarboxylate transporter substrate binding protein n=1 Tax=Pararhodobacter marinus TaxID=2184063 RepID=UPI0035119D81
MRKTLASSLALIVGFGATQALAEWPERPITMIVPYNPGGTTDILARRAADAISAAVGQPVVVENRPGAGGVVGATQAAQAEGDGYTIFFGNNATQVVQPLINPAVSYDPQADFVGVATVADAASFLAVNGDLPVTNVEEFVSWLGENDATYGTAGVGSMGQFTAEMFLLATETDATHIPYQGSNNAMAAVMSGEIDFMADPVAATQAGDSHLRIIAALTADRHPNLPTCPPRASRAWTWRSKAGSASGRPMAPIPPICRRCRHPWPIWSPATITVSRCCAWGSCRSIAIRRPPMRRSTR